MPGKVGVKIKAGRNLPVMDRGSDTTDAYVEIKLGNVTHKTDVCRKSLNPQWNTDWFRFEVDDAELQDEPLQIRLMDYDTYSANDAIGKVNISLNPLCLETSGQATQGKGTVLSGWIPVFDTMHGIRGEVNVIVKVDLFSDLNKFRQSSCGIQFFHSQCIPYGYRAQVIHGFVEELVVNDDPEYQWIDKIRTPRASNEARQVVFLKLSGQVQRKMGLKAINMGANAVIGYTQCFDLEGDVGVVARGIGTAISLIKDTNTQPVTTDNALIEEKTLKYLKFLTGESVRAPEWPEYKIHLRKSRSSTLFELKRSNEIPRDDRDMLDLIRQEDERGEKPTKKLSHHMRRFKYSRNVVNEKCSALMRKIGNSGKSKISCASITKSLDRLFLKDDAIATTMHKAKDDTLKTVFKSVPTKKSKSYFTARSYFRNTSHAILRSISDDSAVKQSPHRKKAKNLYSMDAVAIDEYQDSTRSSPNISTKKTTDESNEITYSFPKSGSLFGNFSNHEPHLINKILERDSRSSSSTNTSLTSPSESFISETDEGIMGSDLGSLPSPDYFPSETVVNGANIQDSIELSKIGKILQIGYDETEDEKLSNTWIKPGCGDNTDDSLPDLRRTHSMINDLKVFSHHIQELISTARNSVTLEPVKAKLPYIMENEYKLISSSQPIISAFTENSDLQSKHSKKRLSSSLADLNTSALASPTFKIATNVFCLPYTQAQHTNVITSQPSPNCPILQICPSTPTESDKPNDFMCTIQAASLNAASAVQSLSVETSQSSQKSRTLFNNKEQFINSDALCRPFRSYTALDHYFDTNTSYTNTSKSSLLAPSVSLFRIKHHRSLNELNAGITMASASATDSPSMKRFTSPASAAIVAAAYVSGPATGSRSKLSLSPARSGITAALASTASTTATQCENSTTSKEVPKEVAEMCRRSSDSDLSVTPKGNSFCVASERLVAATALMRLNQPAVVAGKTNDSAMDMLEYPFLTMTIYPPGFILHLGATVAARSVKLLERVPNPDEPEVRDSWWTELRMEIRSHARALGCNVVLGYSESTTISDDVCVLSATGTAAVINMSYNRSVSQTDIFTKNPVPVVMSGSLEERDRNGVNEVVPGPKKEMSWHYGTGNPGSKKFGLPTMNIFKNSCTMCHIPYNLSSVPFNVKMKKCAICRKGRVPDVLLATLEVPEYLQVTGRGCFIQAQVVRSKKDLRSELNAKEISDGLPFLEYELHRVLINKLKAKGMNAIFGLKAQVAIGERMIALIATGTALFLTALPMPQVPKIVAGNSWTDKQKLNELQKKLQETFERNQEVYQLKCIDPDSIINSGGGATDKQSDTDESDEEVIEIDLNCGNKDTCVLEVDDIEDLEIISLLMESYPPEGFHVVNTQIVPGMLDMEAVKNLQMFTQVWRAKLDVGPNINGFPKHFQKLMQTIYFKLRTMIPCAICDLRFRLDFPESDQIQLLVTGMALGLGDASNKTKYRRKTVTNISNKESVNNINGSSNMNAAHGQKRTLQDEDYIFPLDEDQMTEAHTSATTSNLANYGTHSLKLRKTSPSRTSNAVTTKAHNPPFRNRYFPLRDRYGIDMTPLSFIPGGKIEKYLGNLNFFFIRESTSIREIGGISGFVHSFITELLGVVRSNIAALGGNAMVSFYMTELILVDSQHKNQGQCLISVGGDAVYVSYFADD